MDASGAAQFLVAAEAYDGHVCRYSRELAEQLCAIASVGQGQQALDVGCGPGALTEVLAGLVGASGVAALDPSPPFVDACRARVPGSEVQQAAAERLPFTDGVFDVVLSQLVVNFMADAAAGIREMRRVTRPGGRVASAVWDYPGEMTLLRTFWDAAADVDVERAVTLDEGKVMRYCGEGELAPLWDRAGLQDVTSGALVMRAHYETFADLWKPFAAGVGPSGAYFASLPNMLRADLLDRWHRRLGSPAGAFELTARAWYVVGRA